jgi:hypothetical protein
MASSQEKELRALAEDAGWEVNGKGRSLSIKPKDGRSLEIDKLLREADGITKTVEVLKLANLSIDEDYQRDVDEAWVNRLQANWNPLESGILAVSRRKNGQLWVMDGQHRREAMMRLGITEATCEVFTGLTPAMEAIMFDRLNTRKAVHAYSRFRARLAGGDPVAVEIRDTLASWNARTDIGIDRGYPCVVQLERAHAAGTLAELVEILELSWPREGVRHTPAVVRGMDYFLSNYAPGIKGFNVDRAVERFSKVPLRPIVLAAKGDMAGSRQSHHWWVALHLRQVYSGRRKA